MELGCKLELVKTTLMGIKLSQPRGWHLGVVSQMEFQNIISTLTTELHEKTKQNKKIPAYFIVLFLVFLKSYQLLFVAVLQIFLVLSFWTYKRTVFLVFCDWVRRCDLFWTMSCNKNDIVSHSRFPYWCGRLRSSVSLSYGDQQSSRGWLLLVMRRIRAALLTCLSKK